MPAAPVEQSKPTEPSAENEAATTQIKPKNFYFLTSGDCILRAIEILLGIIILPLFIYTICLIVAYRSWPKNPKKNEQVLVAYLLLFLVSALDEIAESIRNPFDERKKHSKGAFLWCGLRAFVALTLLILLMDEVFGINSFSVNETIFAISACVSLIALYFHLENRLLKRLRESLTQQVEQPRFVIVVIDKRIV